MQANRSTPTKRRRVTALRVIMVLLLVVGCAFAIFRLTLRPRLNARIEAIRAAGYPVTCDELDKWYAIPDGAENAADTLTDAFSYYVEPQDSTLLPIAGRVGLPARTEPLAEETKALVAQYLADNREALELLHAGAAIENCRYPVDLTAGPEALFHDFTTLKGSVRLLNVEAVSHVDSDPGLSVRSIVSSFGLTRSLEKEPVLDSQLVRTSCQDLTASTLEHLVNMTDFTDEQLCDLSRAVIDAEAPSALSRGFVGERCMVLAWLDMPAAQAYSKLSEMSGRAPKSRLGANMGILAFQLHRFAGLTDKSAIILLDAMEGYVKATQLPLHRHREAIKPIDARYEAASRSDLLLGAIASPLGTVDRINLRSIAHLWTAQVALAIQRYRLAAGELPDTLANLVPSYLDTVLMDPFDGNELRYKKLAAGGFVVYSIGEDLSDDGGKEKLPKSKRAGNSRNWDITFIVER